MAQVADCEVDVRDVLEELGLSWGTESRGWVSLNCPFHSERRPSFTMSIETGGWKCYHDPSLKGGIVKFVALVREVDYDEAVVWLVGRRTSTLSAAERLQQAIEKWNPKVAKPVGSGLGSVVQWAAQYDSLDPTMMAKYFFERGFTERTMRSFGVRYDPNERALMWPMRDASFNLQGFTLRRLPGQGEPKYLYPDGCWISTLLFPLSHFVGNGDVVLVEGPMDAMWLHQSGRPKGLALMGSSITEQQITQLRSLARTLVLAFDNDRFELEHDGPGELLTSLVTKQLGAQFEIKHALFPTKDIQMLPEEEARRAVDTAKTIWYSDKAQPERRVTP